MPSFDIVSKTNLSEVDNGLQNLMREVRQRFDFKGTECSVERTDNVLTVLANDEFRLKQMRELLATHLIRRKVDPSTLLSNSIEKASGNTLRQTLLIRQGIPQDLSKRIIKGLKDSRLKIQATIQGDEIRVNGKSRDELQQSISVIKDLQLDLPMQYVNFRE